MISRLSAIFVSASRRDSFAASKAVLQIFTSCSMLSFFTSICVTMVSDCWGLLHCVTRPFTSRCRARISDLEQFQSQSRKSDFKFPGILKSSLQSIPAFSGKSAKKSDKHSSTLRICQILKDQQTTTKQCKPF